MFDNIHIRLHTYEKRMFANAFEYLTYYDSHSSLSGKLFELSIVQYGELPY